MLSIRPIHVRMRSILTSRCNEAFQSDKSSSASFSTSSANSSYADTRQNLKIGAHTKVIYQGFTGRQATANAKQSIGYGTRVVGGVTPGRSGDHLGLPVLSTVREAKELLNPDATAVFVAAQYAGKAIEEAIEAEIPLIVAVAEHVPIHDIMRIHSILRTQSKSRFVGANCPGIISPVGHCRIGFQPLSSFSPGVVGIVAKSGTLSYEAVASTTRAGLGQSLVIGMGGDIIAGTNFIDALDVFEYDSATKGIVIVGEIGGTAEEEAAEWIKDYRRRTRFPNTLIRANGPIMALIGGLEAAPGRVMGHAGAFIAPGEADAKAKIKALERTGCTVVSHPAKFGEGMKSLLALSPPISDVDKGSAVGGKRMMHTLIRPFQNSGFGCLRFKGNSTLFRGPVSQRRKLFVRQEQALELLHKFDIPFNQHPKVLARKIFLAISVDRSACSPCIVASSGTSPEETRGLSRKFPFDYCNGFDLDLVRSVAQHLHLDSPTVQESLSKMLSKMLGVFKAKEAFLLEFKFDIDGQGSLVVEEAIIGFDDAAYKSANRQGDVHSFRRIEDEEADEVEAEREGIVYIRLPGDANIGTLVNGAGLAMNTNDALAAQGGRSTNFLDTGGKATKETVKSSFQIILRDQRVKAIFVNIFGGLTLCDMIAEGIILAFQDLRMKVPVVVRLRGTNEELGQKMIADSGLPLYAYDNFEEAAEKVIELANGS